MSSPKTRILLGAGLVTIVCIAWVVWGQSRDVGPRVPEAFNVENIQQKMNEPDEMKAMFSSSHYRGLTAEQRQQVVKNKEQAYSRMVESRIDEYLDADRADRDTILDRHLDQWVVQWEKKKTDEPTQQKRPQKRANKVWTRQERKAKSESANPDQMAQARVYKAALMKRAEARGIEWPGPGGRSSGRSRP